MIRMVHAFSAAVAVILLGASPAKADTFTVVGGEIVYTTKHLLKTTTGTSKSPLGKVRCSKGLQDCEFLFAVKTATFESGNSNRDSHMRESVKEATHPIASVSGRMGDLLQPKGKIPAHVEFAGVAHDYEMQDLHVVRKDKSLEVNGKLVLSLAAHSVKPPSLLGASIEDPVPVQVHLLLSRE